MSERRSAHWFGHDRERAQQVRPCRFRADPRRPRRLEHERDLTPETANGCLDAALPDELKSTNPLGIMRMIDGDRTRKPTA